ncbi:MAG: TRAM domain-containing protein [Candidatus Marsarchaeota archaeon]|jgi:predicted RNA-binding protein with TRAM domain
MSFRRGTGGYFQKPVEEGKEYDVQITDTSRRGEGVAKIERFIIFVPGTKQGDNVRVKITRVTPRYATGVVVNPQGSDESPKEE